MAVIGGATMGGIAWNNFIDGDTFFAAPFLVLAALILSLVPFSFRFRWRNSRLSDEQAVTTVREWAPVGDRFSYATTPKERRILFWVVLAISTGVLFIIVSIAMKEEELRMLDLVRENAVLGVFVYLGYAAFTADRREREWGALFPTETDDAEAPASPSA